METFKLVLPEHLNHYGFLFGGNLLKWIDEAGWIAASLDYPGRRFVTVGMDDVQFRSSVRLGTVLRIRVTRLREGNTSVTYRAEAFRDSLETGEEQSIFATDVTFVRVDEDGRKQALGG